MTASLSTRPTALRSQNSRSSITGERLTFGMNDVRIGEVDSEGWLSVLCYVDACKIQIKKNGDT